MRVLVTGGAGFIGTRLVRRLASAHEVVVLDNLHPQVHQLGEGPRLPAEVHFWNRDVTKRESWYEILDSWEPEAVLHLAAETGTGQSLREPDRHTEVNVHGLGVMLAAFAALDVLPRKIILASSRAVYGEGAWLNAQTGERHSAFPRLVADLDRQIWEPRIPGTSRSINLPHDAERVPARPTNVYAATKLAQEHVLQAWCEGMGVASIVLRLQNVYGSGQAVGNPYTGVLTGFARTLIEDRQVHVFEGGGIVRDFVHVDDVARAFESAIDQCEGVRTPVDIGYGEPLTLLDCANLLQQTASRGNVRVTDEYRPGDVRAAYADISRARQILGWEPAIDFATGAVDLLEGVRRDLAA